jgi:nucleoside phosphorylase
LVAQAKPGTWLRVSGSLVQGKNAGDGATGKPLLTAEIPSTWKLPELLGKAKSALLSSGETFINTTGQRQSLASSGAWLVDMNAYGLHSACANHDVPLHIWRVVSDNADEQAGATFQAFVKTYDGAGGKALAQLIKDLPANPKAATSYPGIRQLLERREPSK